jgi:hypothetical protein
MVERKTMSKIYNYKIVLKNWRKRLKIGKKVPPDMF